MLRRIRVVYLAAWASPERLDQRTGPAELSLTSPPPSHRSNPSEPNQESSQEYLQITTQIARANDVGSRRKHRGKRIDRNPAIPRRQELGSREPASRATVDRICENHQPARNWKIVVPRLPRDRYGQAGLFACDNMRRRSLQGDCRSCRLHTRDY